MKISYKPLWKLLIDRGLTKGELATLADISTTTISKMGKGLPIVTDVILKVCVALKCDIADVMEIEEGE